ncbi:HEXXH motif domain-containing protein [Lentzea sp. NEAU-D7]|uniref:HEXXH motif domain-containing protein n=1 Tax=Lentzea sp. NEAU-D7 TaxID=2994667 RepID=UPI00224A94EF|nr:HEXXH motif domain-containing protein [Lentzea sp. NEAU-D7]MCX2952755.1 HEXXH motif domain-containing protein [Lentzea sp. NEAU-D7]
MLTSHRLPLQSVDQLARGGGDDAVLARLNDGQFSARLVALRALLDEVAGRSLLLEIDEAWDLLVLAQRKSPGLVRQVLMLPQVGAWLTDVLRRLRGTMKSAEPLWVEVGHLRCVAAAAAHLCDIDFSLDVPVSRGVISLPSLGIAAVPVSSHWAVARAEAHAGRLSLFCGEHAVRVPEDENWSPVHRVVSGDFRPLLDDVEPHRDYRAKVPPLRLTDIEIERWARGLDEARVLLGKEYVSALTAMVTTVVPVAPANDGTPYSGSSADAYGAVLLSEPPDSTAFAETLAHEVQHTKLAALMTMEPLYTASGNAYCYAPWREDPRPLSGLYQGAYAFLGVTDFWRAHRLAAPSGRADFEFAYWCGQTTHATRFLRGRRELTPLGRRFATIMAARLKPWNRIKVCAAAGLAARLAALDHRATWRARHLTPDPAGVSHLADLFLAGHQRPPGELPPSTLSPGPAPPLPRIELRRRRFHTLENAQVPAATDADLLHVAGDQEGATRLYLADIGIRPDDAAAWIGLGLADPAARTVLRAPEVVMAVHAEVARRTGEFPDPRAIAAWVGR